jgi:hypothetical protein
MESSESRGRARTSKAPLKNRGEFGFHSSATFRGVFALGFDGWTFSKRAIRAECAGAKKAPEVERAKMQGRAARAGDGGAADDDFIFQPDYRPGAYYQETTKTRADRRASYVSIRSPNHRPLCARVRNLEALHLRERLLVLIASGDMSIRSGLSQ